MNLGDLYLEKARYQDAAETYEAFVAQDPNHPKSPLLQVEVIEADGLNPADQLNMAFRSSLVTHGTATGVVVATGLATEK